MRDMKEFIKAVAAVLAGILFACIAVLFTAIFAMIAAHYIIEPIQQYLSTH